MPGPARACEAAAAPEDAPWLQVQIEVPKGGFVKRVCNGPVDFVAPLPCPFNYGSVPGLLGLDNDGLDAIVLGRRLPAGSRIWVQARAAVRLRDQGRLDDKLICAAAPLTPGQRHGLAVFFRLYGRCKWWLNLWRGRHGANAFEGWCTAAEALARARPRTRR